MKQHVNLYLPEFRKKKEWLNADRMLQIFLGVTVLMLLFSGVEWLQKRSAANAYADAQTRMEQAADATRALIASFGTQAEDQSLVEGNLRLKETLSSKQAVLNYLGGIKLGNTKGFSEFLIDLAQYHVEGLRLTNIKFAQNGAAIELVGQVSNAGLVPLYLQNLGQGTVFNGMESSKWDVKETFLKGNESAGLKDMKAFEFTVTTDNFVESDEN